MARGALVDIDASSFHGVHAGLSFGDHRTMTAFVPRKDFALHLTEGCLWRNPAGASDALEFARQAGDDEAVPHSVGAGFEVGGAERLRLTTTTLQR